MQRTRIQSPLPRAILARKEARTMRIAKILAANVPSHSRPNLFGD
jgi:hypothetical protein